mgnify:CR=1 FL=1
MGRKKGIDKVCEKLGVVFTGGLAQEILASQLLIERRDGVVAEDDVVQREYQLRYLVATPSSPLRRGLRHLLSIFEDGSDGAAKDRGEALSACKRFVKQQTRKVRACIEDRHNGLHDGARVGTLLARLGHEIRQDVDDRFESSLKDRGVKAFFALEMVVETGDLDADTRGDVSKSCSRESALRE